ncbi:MAG: inositol monophosphatase family protein [Acidobacteriota bacterium]
MMESDKDLLAVATEIAREAGQMLLSQLGSNVKISKKGRIDLVTEMDLRVEQTIVDRIRLRFPDHDVLAEERGSQGKDGPFKWIIDPLDGTTNYAHGYRFFSVSIALEIKEELILGVVYDPVTDELFSAKRGQGATLNDHPIRVSDEGQLIDSMLATGFSYDREQIKKNLPLFNRMILYSQAIRRDGSAALDLCYVACGRFDGFWELSLSPWDVAAGRLILEEAGGRITNCSGLPCTIYDPELLASNGKIHSAMMELLTG